MPWPRRGQNLPPFRRFIFTPACERILVARRQRPRGPNFLIEFSGAPTRRATQARGACSSLPTDRGHLADQFHRRHPRTGTEMTRAALPVAVCLTVFMVAELRALAAPNWGLFFSRRRQTSETKEPSSRRTARHHPPNYYRAAKTAGPQATFGAAQPLWPT